jgi:P63C domain
MTDDAGSAHNAAKAVISKFGSQEKLAEAIGTRQSTVAHWARTGIVPPKWQPKIISAADAANLSVTEYDFVIRQPTAVVRHRQRLPYALASAVLTVGDDADETGAPEIACYNLSDGRRVLSRTSALGALAAAEDVNLGGDLVRYVKPAEKHLRVSLEDELIEFTIDNVSNKRVLGITAECFLEICRAFVRAREAGDLVTGRQEQIAKNAGAFLAACANVGLIALIDEATGYQYTRAEDALRVKLRAYLEQEMRGWEKTFPDELWIEFGRLTGWKGGVQQRPKYWGRLVNELVYQYLDPDVYDWLKNNAPPPRKGQNYHQWLTSNYGLKKLIEHIWMLVGMASACSTMEELRRRMATKFGKEPFQLMLFLDPLTELPPAT